MTSGDVLAHRVAIRGEPSAGERHGDPVEQQSRRRRHALAAAPEPEEHREPAADKRRDAGQVRRTVSEPEQPRDLDGDDAHEDVVDRGDQAARPAQCLDRVHRAGIAVAHTPDVDAAPARQQVRRDHGPEQEADQQGHRGPQYLARRGHYFALPALSAGHSSGAAAKPSGTRTRRPFHRTPGPNPVLSIEALRMRIRFRNTSG